MEAETGEKATLVKAIRTNIWGSLSTRNTIYKTTRQPLDIDGGNEIMEIQPRGEFLSVGYCKKDKYYKYSYGRIGAFLTACCRKRMASMILPIIDNVYRVHTDSALCSGLSDEFIQEHFKLGKELGDFGIDKQGTAHIKNANIVEWSN